MQRGQDGSHSKSTPPRVVRLWVAGAMVALAALQLVLLWWSAPLSMPLPLRHAASELTELRLMAQLDDYRSTLLWLPGWLFLWTGGALGKLVPLWLVQRLAWSLALVGAPLVAERFGRAVGRPFVGGLSAAALGSCCVLYYGLTAHALSLLPFWWGAITLVKYLDDQQPRRVGALAAALFLCAGLSAATFAVLACAVLAQLTRAPARGLLLALSPSLLWLAAGLASIGEHPRFVQPGDPFIGVWAGNWPMVRDLPVQIFEGAPAWAVPLLPSLLVAALLLLLIVRGRREARVSSRVVRALLLSALFFFFYLPRGATEPVRIEALGIRLVTVWIPLLFMAAPAIAAWRRLALVPLVLAAILAPVAARAQLASVTRPLAVYQLALLTAPGARVCVVGAEPRSPAKPLSFEGRSENGELWAFVARGGAIPSVRRPVGPLAITPGHPPTPPDWTQLLEQSVNTGDSCDDYLVYRAPLTLDRDPTLRRGADRAFWIHYHRIHPRPETP